jgi:hypothetical protein
MDGTMGREPERDEALIAELKSKIAEEVKRRRRARAPQGLDQLPAAADPDRFRALIGQFLDAGGRFEELASIYAPHRDVEKEVMDLSRTWLRTFRSARPRR